MADVVNIPPVASDLERWARNVSGQVNNALQELKSTGAIFDWNKGCLSIPINQTESGAEEIVFQSEFAGNGTVLITVIGAEGGVTASLNGTNLGTLSNPDTTSEIRYEFFVSNLVNGLNSFKIWSTTSDVAELRRLEIWRNHVKDALDTASTSATNFNNRNDRDGSAVVNPTIASNGTAIDHVENTDGSADISFEWAWAGTESDIDGFEIFLRQSSSIASYVMGTSPSQEQTWFVPAEKRVAFFYGMAVNKRYTFGIRAYRIVDPDVNANGVIKSNIVQPSLGSEDPFQPSSNVAFSGDVTGTVDNTPAGDVNKWSKIVDDDGNIPENTATAGGDLDVTARNKNFKYGERFWTPVNGMQVVEDPAEALKGNFVATTTVVGNSALINDVLYPVGPGKEIMVQGYIKTSADFAVSDKGFGAAAGWRVRWLDEDQNVVSNTDQVEVTAPQTTWFFQRETFTSPSGAAFANLSPVVNGLDSGQVWFDGGDMIALPSSSDINYTAPFVSSIPRSVQQRIDNMAWFEDFGGTVGGATDEITALNALIAATVNEGVPGLLPYGAIGFASELVIPALCNLKGGGWRWQAKFQNGHEGSTLLRYIGTGGTDSVAVRVADSPFSKTTQPSTFLSHVRMSDMVIDANEITDIGLYIGGVANDSSFKRIAVTDAKEWGARVHEVFHIQDLQLLARANLKRGIALGNTPDLTYDADFNGIYGVDIRAGSNGREFTAANPLDISTDKTLGCGVAWHNWSGATGNLRLDNNRGAGCVLSNVSNGTLQIHGIRAEGNCDDENASAWPALASRYGIIHDAQGISDKRIQIGGYTVGGPNEQDIWLTGGQADFPSAAPLVIGMMFDNVGSKIICDSTSAIIENDQTGITRTGTFSNDGTKLLRGALSATDEMATLTGDRSFKREWDFRDGLALVSNSSETVLDVDVPNPANSDSSVNAMLDLLVRLHAKDDSQNRVETWTVWLRWLLARVDNVDTQSTIEFLSSDNARVGAALFGSGVIGGDFFAIRSGANTADQTVSLKINVEHDGASSNMSVAYQVIGNSTGGNANAVDVQ